MRYKDTIKLAKKALKQPWLYTEEELLYMRKALRLAKAQLKLKQMKKHERKINSGDSESRGEHGIHRQSEQSSESGES